MSPSVIKITDQQAIKSAIAALSDGQCVAMPTETVYGLAADATDGEAVARIFEMKGRPRFNPLICHVSDLEMAHQHGCFCDLSKQLATAFWPGPLTLVVAVREKSALHPLVSAGLPTVGLRCPEGLASTLIQQFGKPLAAPSANRSGRISPTRADHVAAEFHDTNLLVLDGGPCERGLESTIVKVEGNRIVVLRPGSITAAMIKAETGVMPEDYAGGGIVAPGMMTSHYAPDATVILNCKSPPETGAWLQFGETVATKLPHRNLSVSGSLTEAAANLYGHLKELDAMNAGTIFVSPIPLGGIGIAINDRLRRAAAPRHNHDT